jgi:hypothetical protein
MSVSLPGCTVVDAVIGGRGNGPFQRDQDTYYVPQSTTCEGRTPVAGHTVTCHGLEASGPAGLMLI